MQNNLHWHFFYAWPRDTYFACSGKGSYHIAPRVAAPRLGRHEIVCRPVIWAGLDVKALDLIVVVVVVRMISLLFFFLHNSDCHGESKIRYEEQVEQTT